MSIVEANMFGCTKLVCGKLREVWICDKVIKDFRKADKQMQQRIAKILDKYCDCERSALGPTQFKLAQREKKGGKSIALKEFKAYQLRLYGIEETIEGNQIFIIVTVDAQKKQNKAKLNKISTALSKSWIYTEEIEKHHGKS